ncbi:hypothetical protein AN964_14165 [Heyndrickxia shackletonii]|uniref:Uncharacterized protein n=1 Tax=Heyndrickxia shackletonii TaxID=157838 RepID=A0A0Q3WYZ3_9BACI|nr:hypothetical protein [Heyndrickxia shackletonii]KQL54525.1 hypothetical protein AN964_14165 [Heyndrickxia shackletonii]NEZ02056.1 hypothetical protein [Heyndrickxia shackletonii]
MAKKRIKRKPKEIREMIETTDMKYIMLNNRLFDDFYSKGKVTYKPVLMKEKNKDTGKVEEYWLYHDGKTVDYSENNIPEPKTATFDERDFLIIILIKFLQQQNFVGYSKELADYLFKSKKDNNDKRMKQRLKKLQVLQGTVNNIYHHKDKKRVMHLDGTQVRLINEEKVEGYEGNTKRIFYKWHLNFDCDYKIEKDKDKKETEVPTNFFRVTIYDLDLYTNGILNEKEFITYLYFIRSFNPSIPIWHSIGAISEKTNVKNVSKTDELVERLTHVKVKDKFCKEDETFPLIHVDRPENYKRKILERQQPSSFYKPIYHLSTMKRLMGEDDPNYYSVQEDNPSQDIEEDEIEPKENFQVVEDDDLSFLDELD